MSSVQWVKNLYYYLVMLISLFFLVIGSFNIIRTGYIYNFAPRLLKQEVQYRSFGANACQEQYKPLPTDTNGVPQPTPIDQAACDKQIAENKGIWLEENLTWSTIAVVLAGLVMGAHYFLMGKSVKIVTEKTKK
jgi:hypothetical protein